MTWGRDAVLSPLWDRISYVKPNWVHCLQTKFWPTDHSLELVDSLCPKAGRYECSCGYITHIWPWIQIPPDITREKYWTERLLVAKGIWVGKWGVSTPFRLKFLLRPFILFFFVLFCGCYVLFVIVVIVLFFFFSLEMWKANFCFQTHCYYFPGKSPLLISFCFFSVIFCNSLKAWKRNRFQFEWCIYFFSGVFWGIFFFNTWHSLPKDSQQITL